MLQQTTVGTVKLRYLSFLRRWPTVESLAEAEFSEVMAEWAGLGYYARARNLLKCARIVCTQFGGRFPETEQELQALPGIGRYTAAAIAAISFGKPAAVVDGNVERVLSRLFLVETPFPAAKSEIRALAGALTPADRPGDYAQAIMDLGATICRPKNPHCIACPWRTNCQASAAGRQCDLPVRALPAPRPDRKGTVYIAWREDGAWLLERRPSKGLLGGMLGWPGGDWSEEPHDAPPFSADWVRVPGEVSHVFTHFRLSLSVWAAAAPPGLTHHAGEFVPKEEFDPFALPTVMRKAYSHALPVIEEFGKTTS